MKRSLSPSPPPSLPAPGSTFMRRPSNPARWARVDHLFTGAMELPPTAWRAWLEFMEPDPAIRQRVLHLLWLDAQSESVRAAGVVRPDLGPL